MNIDDVRSKIPFTKGNPRNDFFRDIDLKLQKYGHSYTEQDLRIISDGIDKENKRVFEKREQRKLAIARLKEKKK